MATLYTDNFNDAFNVEPFTALDNDINGAKLCRFYGEYTLLAELADGDLIKLFRLPAGARLVGMRIVAPAATSGVFDIGWSASELGGEVADPNGIASGLDVSSAVDASMSWSIAGHNKEFSESVDIQIEGTTVTNGSIGDTWKLEVLFVNN